MNYMLTERAARALSRLLKDNGAVVAAKPAETRKTRPDASQTLDEFPFKVVYKDGWRINLPGGCVVDGQTSMSPQGVTQIEGSWYSINSATVSEGVEAPVVLVVRDEGETGGKTAAIYVGPVSSGAQVIFSATLANVFVKVEDGVTRGFVRRQIARSTISIGSSPTGGGSGTEGVSDTFYVVTGVAFNEDGDYALHRKVRPFRFVDGVLKSVGTEEDTVVFRTAMHSEEN